MRKIFVIILLLYTTVAIAWKYSVTDHHFIGTSSETKPTANYADPGSIFRETDTKQLYVYDGSTWASIYDGITATHDSLKADSTTVDLSVKGFNKAAFHIKLIDKDTYVIWNLEGKIGTSDWCSVINADSVYWAADKDSLLTYTDCAILDSLRFKWMKEIGGTGAIFIVNSKVGDPIK